MPGFNFVSNSSFVDTTIYKTQQVFVYSPDGNTFIDVLRDAPLLAGFKETISSGISPLRIQLPRSFDFYDQAGVNGSRGTITQGNVVRFYLFGPSLPALGLIRFQGFIDTIEPEISEKGEETVTITIIPFSSVLGDHGITQNIAFGSNGITNTYMDPLYMFKFFFAAIDPVTSRTYMAPLNFDFVNSAASSGNNASYKFSNQNMQSICDTIIQMLPSNYYYRVNPDNTFTVNVPHTYADHTLIVGKNISNPQYRQDWSQLRNVIVYQGGTPSGTTTGVITSGSVTNGAVSGGSSSGNITGTAQGSFFTSTTVNSSFSGSGFAPSGGGFISVSGSGSGSGSVNGSVSSNVSGSFFGANVSGGVTGGIAGNIQITSIPMQVVKKGTNLSTFGERIIYQQESRITDLNTLNIIALSLLTQYNRYTVRTKVRVPDNSGPFGMGYPIDTLKVGETVLIVDPTAAQNTFPTLWNVATWDVDNWDFKIGVDLNSSLFDHVLPIVAIDYGFDYVDIELDSVMPNLSRNVYAIQQTLQDFSVGMAQNVAGNYSGGTPGGTFGYITG